MTFRLRSLFLLTLAVALLLYASEHLTVSMGYDPFGIQVVNGRGKLIGHKKCSWLRIRWNERDLIEVELPRLNPAPLSNLCRDIGLFQ